MLLLQTCPRLALLDLRLLLHWSWLILLLQLPLV
jgi:hypothetical protein